MIELLVLALLIGRLASVPELGAWTFAMSMVILPLSLIAIPIAEVLFSAFSRLRDEPERMSALWLDSIAYLAAVLLPLLLGLIVISPDLIPVVFGSRWEVSVGVVQILSVYVLIRGLQSWGSVYMDAVGRPEVTLWTQLASLCLTPVGGRDRRPLGDRGSRRLLRGLPADRGRDSDVRHRPLPDAGLAGEPLAGACPASPPHRS